MLIKATALYALFLAVLFMQPGCAAIPGSKPQSPNVTIASVRPLNLSLTRQKLGFSLRVENPNSFDLPLQALDFTARFAGQDIATGSSHEKVTIPANGEAIVEVEVIAGIDKMLSQFRTMIDSKTLELDYGVTGTVKLANWPRRIPFNVEGELEDPLQADKPD
jgi:LEA14-like dessication related protein